MYQPLALLMEEHPHCHRGQRVPVRQHRLRPREIEVRCGPQERRTLSLLVGLVVRKFGVDFLVWVVGTFLGVRVVGLVVRCGGGALDEPAGM